MKEIFLWANNNGMTSIVSTLKSNAKTIYTIFGMATYEGEFQVQSTICCFDEYQLCDKAC